MTTRTATRLFRLAALAFLGCLLAGSPLLAEVSMDPGAGYLEMALETGEHGGDGTPYPWLRYRPGAEHHVLNEQGDDEGDGHPASTLDNTGRPIVCRADAMPGGIHPIVVSRWDGTSWTDPEAVTDGAVDAADPAVDAAPDGVLAIGWWEPGTGDLAWVRRRLPDGSWATPESVGDGTGTRRFPAVAAPSGDVVLVYSVETGDGAFEVRAARRSEGWAERTLDTGLTESRWKGRGDLAIEVHRVGDTVWADWLRTATELATARLDPATGEWSSPESIPCEASADGWRRARFEARRRALGW